MQFCCEVAGFVGGQYGLLQSYLLKGETPLLLGRPIAQALGLKLELQEMKIKVGAVLIAALLAACVAGAGVPRLSFGMVPLQ